MEKTPPLSTIEDGDDVALAGTEEEVETILRDKVEEDDSRMALAAEPGFALETNAGIEEHFM